MPEQFRQFSTSQFAVLQLEQAILWLVSIGGEAEIEELGRMHERAVSLGDDVASSVQIAIENLMEAISVDI